MQFNLTFFLQIINFGITYWFLNRFMFKPVLSILQKKRIKENLIKQELKQGESLLFKMGKEKKKDLHDFKERIKEEYKVSTFVTPDVLSKIEASVDKKDVEELIRVSTDILVETVPNVD